MKGTWKRLPERRRASRCSIAPLLHLLEFWLTPPPGTFQPGAQVPHPCSRAAARRASLVYILDRTPTYDPVNTKRTLRTPLDSVQQ